MLAPMQYRDFVWPNNPRVFEVEYRRTLHSYKLPFSGYVVQNLGLQNKIIRGEGEFVGPKAYENFRRLAALFEENKGGRLVHPVWPTMRAYFEKLSLKQEPKEDYISYSFEFWEYIGSAFEDAQEAIDDTDYGNPAAEIGRVRYYSAVENDTLRVISQKKGIALSVLSELNPDITNPDAVIAYGRLIRIR